MPGRPIVYETTPDFLRVFGLESLAELPEIEKVDLHVDPSQVEPLEQKQEESTQPDAQRLCSRRSRYDLDMVDDASCDICCPCADRLHSRRR